MYCHVSNLSGYRMNMHGEDGKGIAKMVARAHKSYAKIAKLMIKSGANVNATDNKGITALHIAVRADDLDAVKLLLREGAEVNAKDKKGKSPIDNLNNKSDRISGLDAGKIEKVLKAAGEKNKPS